MCIACELGFWSMMDALPPEARERILREQEARRGSPATRPCRPNRLSLNRRAKQT